eukprot:scaffold128779_cov63-Phaeocystis_antarctica.AAC.1
MFVRLEFSNEGRRQPSYTAARGIVQSISYPMWACEQWLGGSNWRVAGEISQGSKFHLTYASSLCARAEALHGASPAARYFRAAARGVN